MTHHGKADWTNDERVQRMAKTYTTRYDDIFWKALDNLVGTGQREVVADFGCGPGLLLTDVTTRFNASSAIGFDESKEMLSQADVFMKERTDLDTFKLIETNFDIEEIPVESDHIDFGFSGFMLHEVADPSDFVSKVYSHIKSGGVFVVYDFISGNEEMFVKTMVQHGMSEERSRKRYPHMCKHSAGDIVEILQVSGFKDCRIGTINEIRAVVAGHKR
ncbi:MAG: class I SAM-dependent methyltransferase [Candidatus Thorarchaeota archaeon]